MNYEAICNYLSEKIPELVLGDTLFCHSMPPAVDSGILICDSNTGFSIDPEIPGLRKGNFQLVGRGSEYEEVRQLLTSVSSELTLSEIEFDGCRIKTMRPLNEPVGLKAADGSRFEFSVNFFAIYYIL